MFHLLDMEQAGAAGIICASMVGDDDDLLRNIARCTLLVTTRLDKIDESLPIEGMSAIGENGFIGPVEPLEEAAMDYDRQNAKQTYNRFSSCF